MTPNISTTQSLISSLSLSPVFFIMLQTVSLFSSSFSSSLDCFSPVLPKQHEIFFIVFFLWLTTAFPVFNPLLSDGKRICQARCLSLLIAFTYWWLPKCSANCQLPHQFTPFLDFQKDPFLFFIAVSIVNNMIVNKYNNDFDINSIGERNIFPKTSRKREM